MNQELLDTSDMDRDTDAQWKRRAEEAEKARDAATKERDNRKLERDGAAEAADRFKSERDAALAELGNGRNLVSQAMANLGEVHPPRSYEVSLAMTCLEAFLSQPTPSAEVVVAAMRLAEVAEEMEPRVGTEDS